MNEVKSLTVRQYLGEFHRSEYEVAVPLDEITGIAGNPDGTAIVLRQNGLFYLLEGWSYTGLWKRLRDGQGFPPADLRETA
jgi:hypothetical protein